MPFNQSTLSWEGTRPSAGELATILEKHLAWRRGKDGGARANLTGANLTGANLARANLTGANLARANLTDANLTGANLARAYLTCANLTCANLAGANLTCANLAGAKNLPIGPEIVIPSLHRQILAAIALPDCSLDMSAWHKCETTHCRAGWAIHLAGAPGKVLERCYGPSVAGALITLASCPDMERVPNFYASNEEALADIRACAKKEPELAAV